MGENYARQGGSRALNLSEMCCSDVHNDEYTLYILEESKALWGECEAHVQMCNAYRSYRDNCAMLHKAILTKQA